MEASHSFQTIHLFRSERLNTVVTEPMCDRNKNMDAINERKTMKVDRRKRNKEREKGTVHSEKSKGKCSVSCQNQERVKQQREEGSSSNTIDSCAAHSLPWLPVEMVMEILSRLRPKPLLKFRSVCRSWRSIIDSHHFIHNLHLPRCRETSPTHFLLQKKNNFFYLDNKPPCSSIREIRLPFSISNGDKVCLTSSYDGLLCFSQSPRTRTIQSFHVVSPITGKAMRLPRINYINIDSSTCQIIGERGRGVYKVLLVYEEEGAGSVRSRVYTLGQDVAWRDVPNRFPVWETVWQLKEYPYVNGAVHCVYSSAHKDLGGRVAAFDVSMSNLGKSCSPGCCSSKKRCWNDDFFLPANCYGHLPRVVELKGLLALLHMDGPGTLLETWLLTDYVGGVWTKDHKICLELLYKELGLDMKQYRRRQDSCLSVLPMAKISDRELVMKIVTDVPSSSSGPPSSTGWATYVFSYDPLLKNTTLPSRVENVGLYIDGAYEIDGGYIESLASPWDTSNPLSKKKRRRRRRRRRRRHKTVLRASV